MPYKDKRKQQEYQRQWYRKNKEVHLDRGAKNKQKRVVRNLEWIDRYKQQRGCIMCGETHPICLDFHHTDPSTKEQSVSYYVQKGYNITRINNEIQKCVILCSNCHRKLHYYEGRGKTEESIKFLDEYFAGILELE